MQKILPFVLLALSAPVFASESTIQKLEVKDPDIYQLGEGVREDGEGVAKCMQGQPEMIQLPESVDYRLTILEAYADRVRVEVAAYSIRKEYRLTSPEFTSGAKARDAKSFALGCGSQFISGIALGGKISFAVTTAKAAPGSKLATQSFGDSSEGRSKFEQAASEALAQAQSVGTNGISANIVPYLDNELGGAFPTTGAEAMARFDAYLTRFRAQDKANAQYLLTSPYPARA